MTNLSLHKKEFIENGFSIEENIFDENQLETIKSFVNENKFSFYERQLFVKFPELKKIVFSNLKFINFFKSICDESFFLTKSIFFNKPSKSNWFVNYHQDLSISVKEKLEIEGYDCWTYKKGQLGVIPPIDILKNTVTFRIHLDDTDTTNGVLKVISKSHKRGQIRIDESFNIDKQGEENICNIKKGGVMIMSPLLLHSSQKSTSENDRRVLHLEFCNQEIPMKWLEKSMVS